MSKLSYRVGTEQNTGKAAGWISQEFGVNINQFGHYTPAQVAALSKLAKDTKFQAKLAKQALAALSEIAKYKEEIERYRKEAIQIGLTTKEQIDKHVLASILRTHEHDAHLKKILQDTIGGMSVIDAKSRSQLDLGRNEFQNKLRLILANHKTALEGQNGGFRESLHEIDAGRQRQRVERKRERNFMSFIRADNYQPSGSKAGGGLLSSLSGWFS